MNALRNVSGQSFLIQRAGRAVVHLMPKRAVIMTDDELRSPQVQRLLAAGHVRLQAINPSASKAKKGSPEAGAESGEKKSRPASDRKREK